MLNFILPCNSGGYETDAQRAGGSFARAENWYIRRNADNNK
jgi:hypothetical protein